MILILYKFLKRILINRKLNQFKIYMLKLIYIKFYFKRVKILIITIILKKLKINFLNFIQF
jgi:hypothetical protein